MVEQTSLRAGEALNTDCMRRLPSYSI